MAAWRCGAGQTLLIPSGPTGKHLFVLLNDPRDFVGLRPRSCVLVPICTIRQGPHDTSCVVRAGEHPFVDADSYVSYRHARVDPADAIEQRVGSNTFTPHQPVRAAMLARILGGVHASPQTKRFIKNLLL